MFFHLLLTTNTLCALMHSKYEVLSTEVCNLEDTKSFGAKAVRRDTTKKLRPRTRLDVVQTNGAAQRWRNLLFFFFSP